MQLQLYDNNHSKMDFKNIIRLFVVIALICYFVNKVISSVIKEREGKIGTLFRRVTEDTVEGRSHANVQRCFVKYEMKMTGPQFTKSTEMFYAKIITSVKLIRGKDNDMPVFYQYPAITACILPASSLIALIFQNYSNEPVDILADPIEFAIPSNG